MKQFHSQDFGSFVPPPPPPPSATYMRQWTGSALVQVMACRVFGAKILHEPMLTYCELRSLEPISVKFESEFYYFQSGKCIRTCRLPTCHLSKERWVKFITSFHEHYDKRSPAECVFVKDNVWWSCLAMFFVMQNIYIQYFVSVDIDTCYKATLWQCIYPLTRCYGHFTNGNGLFITLNDMGKIDWLQAPTNHNCDNARNLFLSWGCNI